MIPLMSLEEGGDQDTDRVNGSVAITSTEFGGELGAIDSEY